MSDPGPFGPDGPFGMNFFADLNRLFAQQGPISWDVTRQIALSVVGAEGSEPNVDPVERMRVEQLARVAELQVTAATGLSVDRHGPVSVVPVTRAAYVQNALEAYRPLFEGLGRSLAAEAGAPEVLEASADDPSGMFGGLMQLLNPMLLGMTAGSLLGHLGLRDLAMYDLPVPRPATTELQLVSANLGAFEAEHSLSGDDLRLWLCLDLLTRHAVLSVPHIGQALGDLLSDYAALFRPDPSTLEDKLGSLDMSTLSDPSSIQDLFGDPEVLLGAMQSDAQRLILPRLETLVAVVLGYADHQVDQLAAKMLGAGGQSIGQAVRARRFEQDQADRFVERLLGLDVTEGLISRGRDFVTGIIDRAGPDALGRLWSDDELPTAAELGAPGLWLARVGLGGNLEDDTALRGDLSFDIPDDISELDDLDD
ncbi:MAG: zinc-dependent metalloprotease [Actinomycetia bacterium]|nr:zinc-dependent metalloprotease [Actinomycetes bacterium]